MLYFAFGSNLNKKQMKRRCRDSKYIGCYTLKNYKLCFRNDNYAGNVIDGGVADIQKSKNSKVLGAIYRISKKDEKNSRFNFYEFTIGKKNIEYLILPHFKKLNSTNICHK